MLIDAFRTCFGDRIPIGICIDQHEKTFQEFSGYFFFQRKWIFIIMCRFWHGLGGVTDFIFIRGKLFSYLTCRVKCRRDVLSKANISRGYLHTPNLHFTHKKVSRVLENAHHFCTHGSIKTRMTSFQIKSKSRIKSFLLSKFEINVY